MATIIVRIFLWLAARDPVPARFHRLAARIAVRLIDGYKHRLSHRSGRCCMFEPSCSTYARAAFVDKGWRHGLQDGARQLRRCGGNTRLLTTVDGRVFLVTNDGDTFDADRLSVSMRRAMARPPVG